MKKILLVILLSAFTLSAFASDAIGEACLSCVGTQAPQFSKDNIHPASKHHIVHTKRPVAKKR